jgi:hypothetical protein
MTSPGAGHKTDIIRGEKDDALGDVGYCSPMRPIGMRVSACWRAGSRSFVPYWCAPHRQNVVAHIGLGRGIGGSMGVVCRFVTQPVLFMTASAKGQISDRTPWAGRWS